MAVLPKRRAPQEPAAHDPAVDEELAPYPELAAAIKANRASFDTYVRSRFLATERFNRDDASREVYGRWRSKVLEAYQIESGKICGSYYCEHIIGASARTATPRLALVFNSYTWGPEEQLLTSCDALYWEGIDYLAGTDRVTFVERLYSVATDVLALLDARCGTNGSQPAAATATPGAASSVRAEALEALHRKLEDVRAFYMKAAPKRARLRYLAGVVGGFAVSVVLTALLLALLSLSSIPGTDREEIVAIWLAGSIGAVVSVLQRVSSESLEVQFEAGRLELALLGAIRPLLGGAIGVALYALFAGGILDFAKPDDASVREIYYFAGIGFLSGFSERFAQDMLVRSTTGFTQDRKAPTEAKADAPPEPPPPTAT